MGETWIGIDASIILMVMILVVGIYVRKLQEKVSNLFVFPNTFQIGSSGSLILISSFILQDSREILPEGTKDLRRKKKEET